MPPQTILVEVTYQSSNQPRFTFNPSPPDVIVVPNQTGGNAERAVCLQLMPESDSGVRWSPIPIIWNPENPGGGGPPSEVSALPEPEANQHVFGILNDNNIGTSNGGTERRYGFWVSIVDVNEETQTSQLQMSADPETVLEPPNP